MNIKDKYSPYQRKVTLRLYRDFYDTNKVIDYIKWRFDIKTTYRGLAMMACKYGIEKRYKNHYSHSAISRDDEKEMVRLYTEKDYSTKKIANLFGYNTRKSITDKLKRHGVNIKSNKKTRNESKSYYDFSLEEITSKEKAYLIGLLLTDGYVIKNYEGIGLSLTDRDCIDFLADYIGMEYYTRKSRKKHHLTRYRIQLFGKRFANQAKRYGIIKNKTYDCPAPKLIKSEIQYIPYILRGAIDGDGWVRKDGKEFFLSSAAEEFIKWSLNAFYDLGFRDLNFRHKKNDSNGIYIIRTARQENIKLLNELIYDKPFGMMRKFDRLKREKPSETIIESA